MTRSKEQAFLRPRARLMQTLGEELISNERVALIELVKNAYDADASTVVISFAPPLVEGQGAVMVWDDGHGMSLSTVRDSWLEVATPTKTRQQRSELKHRRLLGAKGIGRFAASRLAYETLLVTRRQGDAEVILATDWGLFTDDDAYLDQIPLELTSRSPDVFSEDGRAHRLYERIAHADQQRLDASEYSHGTLIELRRLRRAWNTSDLEAFRSSLSRLVPPSAPTELDVPDLPEFSIYLDLPEEFGHLSGFVGPSEALAHPGYRLLGQMNADGRANLQFEHGHSGEHTPLELNLRDTPDSVTETPCGPIKFDIRVWDLEASAVRDLLSLDLGAKNTQEVRELIRTNSGIALYRDGFRVQPFGEPGFDWLRLDNRRINNPTMRLSNNQIAGFVYITADENQGLRDRSHREGLIDTPEYEDLKAIIVRAITEIEQRRYKLRRPGHGASTKIEDGHIPQHDQGPGVFQGFTLDPLRKAVRNRPSDIELSRAFEEVEEGVTQGVRQVQEVLSRFSRLATLGLLVDMILHDGRTALLRISYVLRRFKKLAEKASQADPRLAESILEAEKAVDDQRVALSELFKRIEPLSGRRRGRPRQVSLHDSIQQALTVLEGEAADKGVDVQLKGADQTVTVDQGDMIQIIVNLVSNALYWTSTLPESQPRQIVITTERESDSAIVILVSDSGPGVPEDVHGLVFDAYFTTKPEGVGLGLSIVGTIAKDFYAGDLELVSSGPLPGANFRVRLRKRVG